MKNTTMMTKQASDVSVNSKAGSLGSALGGISKMVKEREEKLRIREEELEEDRRAFAKEVLKMCGKEAMENSVKNNVLRLNVSGAHIDVLRRTLCSVKAGSMLASRFSGRWDDSLEKNSEGRFLIDQPVDLF